MNKKNFITALAASMWLFGCNRLADDAYLCINVDPLKKVFTEETYFVENTDTMAVAKGETAEFQLVFRSPYAVKELKIEAGDLVSGQNRIVPSMKAFVGYIFAGRHGWDRPRDNLFPISDLYPDCLEEVETKDVPMGANQPVWINYAVPRNVAAGDYTATIALTGKMNGKTFRTEKTVRAKVYNVVLPEQTLYMTNYIWGVEGIAKKGEKVEEFSDRYWELYTKFLHIMREHGINVYQVNPGTIKSTVSGNKYTFDFSGFDRMAELVIKEGGATRLESGGSYTPPELRHITDWENDEAALNYWAQYYPAFYEHLKSKGWKDMYMQHIWDEVPDAGAPKYISAAKIIKKYMPDIKIIDAVSTEKIVGAIDVWVPLSPRLCEILPFFQERQAAGEEVWHYTCCAPGGTWANRFLENPLIHMRIQHWFNYRFGTTGYLHWALNTWQYCTLGQCGADNWDWAAGDCFIVYPAEEKVYSSIRLEAMRDGVHDYELLKLLDKKDPAKAQQLVTSVVHSGADYDNNVLTFRVKRKQLLTWLSE